MTGVRGVLLDVDGVLVSSWRPLPGAVETVERLRTKGIPFRLVTNTTMFSRDGLARILRDGGFDVAPDEILTATAATAAYLRRDHAGAKCYLLAAGEATEDLEGIESVDEGADIVVVGDAEDGFNYENLNRAFRMLMDGAILVAMHRGLFWMTEEGPALDVGAFIAGLELASGTKAIVAGKPSPEFFLSALDSIGLPASAVMMVGDDVQSDVNAARELGMPAALVKTGKFKPRDLELIEMPVHVIDSIADLLGILE